MRLILTLMILALSSSAFAQQVVRSDSNDPKKNLVIAEDGVVTQVIVIPEAWTATEWAPFVPAGAEAFEEVGEPVLVGDRRIDGKTMRLVRRPDGLGWHMIEMIDINDPTPELVNAEHDLWEFTGSYRESKIDKEKAALEERVCKLEDPTASCSNDESSVPDQARENARAGALARGGRPIAKAKVEAKQKKDK